MTRLCRRGFVDFPFASHLLVGRYMQPRYAVYVGYLVCAVDPVFFLV